MLRFSLHQLRSLGKGGTNKKASMKCGAAWTVTNTSQTTYSSPEDDYVEEEEVSEIESKKSIEQEEDSLDNDKGFTLSYDDVVDMF